MILTFEFAAYGERWRVRVLETDFWRDVPNVLTLNDRGEISSVGDEPHLTGADAARVVPIYEAATFDPHRVAGCVWYYTRLGHQRVRHGIAHLLDLFDRYDLIFELPGFEEIPADLRRKFEKALYGMPSVSSYSINGGTRKLPWNVLRFG